MGNNIKTDFKETGSEDMHWIYLDLDVDRKEEDRTDKMTITGCVFRTGLWLAHEEN
jgi:hypothetical protein